MQFQPVPSFIVSFKMWRQGPRSSQFCKICNVPKTGEDHDLTEKHLKNSSLLEYSNQRVLSCGVEHGITISCNAESSFAVLFNCVESRITLSVRPNEIVQFHFTVKNENVSADISLALNFVHAVHSLLNFTIKDKTLSIGCKPESIAPNDVLKTEIILEFSAASIGQYELPLMFSFAKNITEIFYLHRDVVVFVEDLQLDHDVVESPFESKPVEAETLFKTSLRHNHVGYEEFKVPEERGQLFAKNISVGCNAPQSEQSLVNELDSIFNAGPTPENYDAFFHNLLWFEEVVVKMQLKKYNMSEVPLERVEDSYLLVVPGLSEKRPSLLPGDTLLVKPSNSNKAMFEAIIVEVLEDAIYFRGLHNEFLKYYRKNGKFDIRFLHCRLQFERMHKAIEIGKMKRIAERVFPQKNPAVPLLRQITQFFNPSISYNPEQRSVIEHIIAGTSGTAPYLIHGPPGTGKTVTVVEAILQIVGRSPHHRVLVCTDSNMAADHVAVQLINYAHFFHKFFLLRANAKFRPWEIMPAALKPYSNGTTRSNWNMVDINVFASHQIVVTTLAHSALYGNLLRRSNRPGHITHLFIDEAAQALEPLTLVPTCGLLAPRGKLILAGDPKQLGPVVISNIAKRIGLGTSLMERLKNTCSLYSDEFNDPNYMVMLRNNFRSHPAIIELPNNLFYNGQLRACAGWDPLSTLNIMTGGNDCNAIAFHGVLSKEQKIGMSPSFFNVMEQMQVHRYVHGLVKLNVPFRDIGIVTPYIRQMYMLRLWLNYENYSGIEVGTVEAFQGKEKRFIIVTTVRANADLLSYDAKFQLGFLVDDKRFNVAITRAKAKLIIIGNPLCLTIDPKWRKYIEKCRMLGTYYGFDYKKINNDMGNKELTSGVGSLLTPKTSADKSDK